MKFLFLGAVFTFCVCSVAAQIAVSTNSNIIYNNGGRAFPFSGAAPVGNTKFIDLKEGSPFFQDNWSSGKIITGEGQIFENMPIKLDLMENKVHTKDSTGKELVIGTTLKEILLPRTSGETAHFVNGDLLPIPKPGWYLLLVNDTLSLLKEFKKQLEQHTSYGSATEYSIKTQESYFAYLRRQEFEIKKGADFVKIFPLKKAEIEQEIKKMNSKDSRERQLSSLATFCNGL